MNAVTATMLDDRRTMAESHNCGFDLAATMTDTSHTPVPLKPSASMLAAGSRAGGVTVETAWKIYLAMLNEAS